MVHRGLLLMLLLLMIDWCRRRLHVAAGVAVVVH